MQRGTETDRGTEIEKQRDRDRHRGSETDKQKDRHTEGQRDTDTQRDRDRHTEGLRQTHRETETEEQRQTHGGSETDTQRDRHTEGQRQTYNDRMMGMMEGVLSLYVLLNSGEERLFCIPRFDPCLCTANQLSIRPVRQIESICTSFASWSLFKKSCTENFFQSCRRRR